MLSAYVAGKGDLNVVYRKVMLSNPLEDEERFRGYVDKAIEEGGVEGYEAYVNEAAGKKERRIKRAEKESREAEKHAKTLGVYDKLFGDEGKSKKQTKQKGAGDEAGLMELMQQRAKGRNDGFLDGLEAKYGGKGKTKKRKEEEPPEEAFARMAKKAKSTPAKEKVKEDDIGDAEETSDDGESLGEEEALPKTPPRGKNHGRKHKLSREQQESPKFTKNVATSTASKKTSRRGGKEKKPVSAQTNVETEPPQEEPSPQPKKKAKKAKTKQ